MAVRTTGAARYFTETFLGGPTREVETNPTIQTTATVGVKSNPDRVGLFVMNLGANDVFAALNNGVSTTNGVKLTNNGGFMSFSVKDDFTLTTREWDMLANGGTSLIYVLEWISDVLGVPEQR